MKAGDFARPVNAIALLCTLKAHAVAIWMPSDTARVREACSGK